MSMSNLCKVYSEKMAGPCQRSQVRVEVRRVKRKHTGYICKGRIAWVRILVCRSLCVSNQRCNCRKALQNELWCCCCPGVDGESSFPGSRLEEAVPFRWAVVAHRGSCEEAWPHRPAPYSSCVRGGVGARGSAFCLLNTGTCCSCERIPTFQLIFLMPISYVFLSTGRHQSCSTQEKQER